MDPGDGVSGSKQCMGDNDVVAAGPRLNRSIVVFERRKTCHF